MNDLIETNQQRKPNSAIEAQVMSRQAQEVQGAIVMAKKFPRDEYAAEQRIITACKRKRLAEVALYSYPRGGKKVTGSSIRLAEVLASNWGNIDYGIIELEQKEGESTMMAYAWDLETNTRRTMTFQTKHERAVNEYIDGKKVKVNKKLEDPRDVYEMNANLGARRVRQCILGLIPGDIQDVAEEEIMKTLQGQNTEPLKTRVVKMLDAFKKQYKVSREMIETKFQCSIDGLNERDLIDLRSIFNSLKDGMSKKEDWFEGVDIKKPQAKDDQPKTEKKAKDEKNKDLFG